MARYKGRHRAPTGTGKKLAALGAAATIPALSVGMAGTAHAGPAEGWDPIIQCESGGNPTIQNANSTASGLFQFINGTWRAYGGTEFAPTAKQATPAQQLIVAERAYAAEGTRPWNASKHCWAGKTGGTTIPKAEKAQTPKKVTKKVEKAQTPVKKNPVEQTQVLPVVTHKGQFTPGGDGTYEVKSGDTLTFIARDYGTTVADLVDKNKDIVEHQDWIYVGEKLNVD